VSLDGANYNIYNLPSEAIISCNPQFGWTGSIEAVKL